MSRALRGSALAAALILAGACSAPITPSLTGATPGPSEAAATTSVPSATPAPSPIAHRIGVRVVDGTGEFFDQRTGERFVPRGANLIRLAGGHHSTLSVGHYDPAAEDANLARMAANGFNTVRVFLDTYAGGLPGRATALSGEYMDNVADFLARAAAHGMVVLLTTDWLPESGSYAFANDPGIEDVNAMYLSKGGVEANARFFGDFAQALVDRGARLDVLLAYELRNELYFTNKYAPFSMTAGTVTTANGRTYDLSSPAEQDRMLEENLVSWIDTMRPAIRAVDPSALITVGFFQPKGPNTSRVGDDRLIETKKAILESSADFIDLHGYPGGELDLRQIVENFKLPAITTKPILMGEFGAEHGAFATAEDAVRALVDWQIEGCTYGFDGWLVWTWDTLEQPEFWNALDADGAMEHALAPTVRPDPCTLGDLALSLELARGASAKASSALPDRPAANAIDGLFDTIWNASAPAPQWIRVDLGSERTVEAIRLLVAQDPAGASRHVASVRGEDGDWRQVKVFKGTTREGDWLEFTPDEPLRGVRYVRVQTTSLAGGLWPAWHEISILGR